MLARLRAPSSFLWRPDDLKLHCLRSVCCAVFDACPTTPLLVLCLAGEVSPHLFSEQVRVEMPVGRLAPADSVANLSPSETAERAPANEEHSELAVYWTDAPMPDSPARRLFDLLSSRGLLIEPFERAEAGLGEVYTDLFA